MSGHSYSRSLLAALIAIIVLGLLAPLAPGQFLARAFAQGEATGANAPDATCNFTNNNLHGDEANVCVGTTNFTSSGANSTGVWKFFSNSTTNSTAVAAECSGGTGCVGLKAIGHGAGVYAEAQTSGPADESYAVKAIGQGSHPTLSAAVYGRMEGTLLSNFAPAVEGHAFGQNGTGVLGHAPRIGVRGYSTSTSPALIIFGGVFTAALGTGVFASSNTGNGLRAQTTGNASTFGGIFTATLGTGLRAFSSGNNLSRAAHVSATLGTGLFANSNSGNAIRANSAGDVSTFAGVFSTTLGVGLFAASRNNHALMGLTTNGFGVIGQSNTGAGVRGLSTSGPGMHASTTSGTVALRAVNPNTGASFFAGVFDGNVKINGTLTCSPSCPFTLGATTSQGDKLMYADASAQNYFSDQGTATLKNGRALIKIDPLFAQTVSLGAGYQVFLTPAAFDSAGIAVGNQTGGGFEVRELNGGKGNYSFHWRITALRKGFENERMAPAPASVPDLSPAVEVKAAPN